MQVLALDTTTLDGSVALVGDDGVVEERRGDGSRTHAQRLPAELLSLLSDRGLGLDAADLFAVASGPGSFTGLRIGIATVQGLAVATGRRLVGVSALDALAGHASRDAEPGTVIGAWMDARRGEVFAALYRVGERTAPVRAIEVEGATVGEPGGILRRWTSALDGRASVFVGDGAMKYRALLDGGAPRNHRVLEHPLLAGEIGRLALWHASRGETIGPAAIHPLYVRRPDAEIERDRKAMAP